MLYSQTLFIGLVYDLIIYPYSLHIPYDTFHDVVSTHWEHVRDLSYDDMCTYIDSSTLLMSLQAVSE